MGAFSNAFTNEKYEEALHNARREYDKINDKAGSKRKNNLLSSYNVSPADLEILSTALYLQKVPDVLGGRLMDKVDIITKDSHLIDSSKIFSRIHPEMRDKINVREKI